MSNGDILDEDTVTYLRELQLTTVEELAVKELKSRVIKDLGEQIYDKNDFIYRFLKAKDFNVDQAQKMLEKTLQWRKRNNVDTIHADYEEPEIFQKYLRINHLGFDKEGSPVYYIPSGKIDIKGLFMSVKYADLERMIIKFSEEAEKLLEEQSKKLKKRISSYIIISDADGLSFANAADRKLISSVIRIDQLHHQNYPERLKAGYVINASSFFAMHYAILKNFLPTSIMNKIFIYGSEAWQDELLKLINPEDLPAFLGGEKTDPDGDPLCKTFINHAGAIPEKYYKHKSKKPLSGCEDVKKLVLDRASFYEITLDVKDGGSLIEWEFEIKNRDIGFGLFYKEVNGEDEQMVELVPLQRLDTDDFAETGLFNCEKAGTYILLFDNSYSWIRSKEIYYRANVVNPKDHLASVQDNNE